MRDSYFTSEIGAIVAALDERGPNRCSKEINDVLEIIRRQLEALLHDERTPERQWRHRLSEALGILVRVMRGIGTPTPSVEALASELAA